MTAYKPREFKWLGTHDVGGWQVKAYSICGDGRPPMSLPNALSYVKDTACKDFDGLEGASQLGYLILHAGEESNWLLARQWISGGIVAGHLAHTPNGDLELCKMPYIECVWESIVTQFEREAWVRHMLTEVPDPKAYLADRLATGRY